jgi:hypothetical protein
MDRPPSAPVAQASEPDTGETASSASGESLKAVSVQEARSVTASPAPSAPAAQASEPGTGEPAPEACSAQDEPPVLVSSVLKTAPPKSPQKAPPTPCAYDKDAQMAKKPGYVARPSYKIGAAVDYRHGVVISSKAILASSGEGACARIVATDSAWRAGKMPQAMVADTGMDDAAFHAHVELYGSVPVTPIQRHVKEASGFGKDRFLYDRDRDLYLCPAGQELGRVSGPDAERITYRANGSICAQCPLRQLCLGKRKDAKTVSRSYNEESRDRVIAAKDDPQTRKIRRRRKAVVEPVFSDYKENMGLRMIWTKGLPAAQFKATMAAFARNIKVLMRKREEPALPEDPNPPVQGPEGTQSALKQAEIGCLDHFSTILRLTRHLPVIRLGNNLA